MTDLERKAAKMRSAIDMIEGALMGFGDMLEVNDLFAGARPDLSVKVSVTLAELRRVTSACAECTRIINSDEFKPDAIKARRRASAVME